MSRKSGSQQITKLGGESETSQKKPTKESFNTAKETPSTVQTKPSTTEGAKMKENTHTKFETNEKKRTLSQMESKDEKTDTRKKKKPKTKKSAAKPVPAKPASQSNWLALKNKLSVSQKTFKKMEPSKPQPSKAEESPAAAQSSQITSFIDESKLTDTLAIDCEMVGVGPAGRRSILARVAVVNSDGEVVYHKYVKPTEHVTDYRTAITGLRPGDLSNAEAFHQVKREVAKLLHHRVVVGHSVKHDFEALTITHKPELIRDTAKYKPLLRDGTHSRSLRELTNDFLGMQIQSGAHSPIEDAQCVMSIYQKLKHNWEREIQHQKELRAKTNSQSK
eukprot:TRINITY_DN6749_c0_g1_i1.p1 TRINITY_DN6749_c0_g1~~TRINITY_DN6749_c0_g1_i1.p1  ORF type:complete len:334 (+),score=95.20 TRINITY_DN6749_c0_g1_i1:54-1055(+)